MSEVLSFGMVGGGIGSLIGEVHRKAAVFDRKAKLVAGCFSRNYDNTLSTGKNLGLEVRRLYENFSEMAEREGAREDKIDFVTIVTPNNLHFEIAKAFLEKGINVICDKPLTLKVEEAEELANLAKKRDLLNCVTYTYSGYSMVKHAREIINQGEIGKIRMVMGEYLQEWLARPVEKKGNRQAFWRTDPKYSGKSNCVADIGSHIENIISYVTDLKIDSLCANLDTFVKGRALDDNAEILIKYTSGARGIYWCFQLAIGHNNGLKIRILGEKGSVEWEQENPDYLKVAFYGRPVQILSRGRDDLYPLASRVSRLPGGHPEGLYEAFANIYSNFSDALVAKKAGNICQKEIDFPTFEDGARGVKFINLCVESSQRGASWISVKQPN
jgi:predicted dehydrogenase